MKKFKDVNGLNEKIEQRPILNVLGITRYEDLKNDNVFVNFEDEEAISFIISERGVSFYAVYARVIGGEIRIDLVTFGSQSMKFMNEKMRESL